MSCFQWFQRNSCNFQTSQTIVNINFRQNVPFNFFPILLWRKWKVNVWVAQSCLTLCDPVDYSLSGSSVHGILQARILEWVAIPFSRLWTKSGIKFYFQHNPKLILFTAILREDEHNLMLNNNDFKRKNSFIKFIDFFHTFIPFSAQLCQTQLDANNINREDLLPCLLALKSWVQQEKRKLQKNQQTKEKYI